MLVFSMGELILILVPCWSPVEGWSKGVGATSGAFWTISTRFHNVDLAGYWPWTISLVSREEPNSGPNPVSFGDLSSDLNTAVFEAEGFSGSNTGAHNWVDVISTCSRVSFTTVELVACAKISWSTTPNIVWAVHHCLLGDGFSGEGWLKVELTVLDEGVGSWVMVDLKFPVSTTTHGDFVFPCLQVEGVEVILEDKCFCECEGAKWTESLKHIIIMLYQ